MVEEAEHCGVQYVRIRASVHEAGEGLARGTTDQAEDVWHPDLKTGERWTDNNGVMKNTSIPTSMLGKKHNSINYHVGREAVAAGVMRVAKEDTRTNPADALTKILRFALKQKLLWPLGHLLISKAHQGTDGSGGAPE
eukprot:g20.t1 g20   contig1:48770-49183(+)